jgi:PAS domain S-box-containing protein
VDAIGEMAQLNERRKLGLRSEEAKYRILAENARDITFLHDVDGRRSYVSPACRQILGYEPDELVALPAEDFVHPDDAPEIARKYRELSAEFPEFTSTHRLRRKDGVYIWVEAEIRLIPQSAKYRGGVIATARDITARRQVEEALRFNESRYRTLADNATDLITLQDLTLRPLYISPASRGLLGYAPDELAAQTTGTLMHPDDEAHFIEATSKLSEASPRSQIVHRLRHRDGSYRWVEASLRLVPPNGDEPARILTVVRDVTERKLAEEAASVLRRLLGDAIDAMQDGVAVYDAEDRLVLLNDALRKQRIGDQDIFVPGRTYEEIVRAYWPGLDDFGIDLDGHLAEALERHRQGDGYPSEVEDRAGNWHLTRHFRTRDGSILTVSTDITALKSAQAEAVRAWTLVSDAIEAMQDSIALFDAQDRLVVTNIALRRRFTARPDIVAAGRTYEEIIRDNWSDEEIASDRDGFDRTVAQELAIHRQADGTPREIKSQDGTWRLNRQFRTADGGILIVSTDITDRRQAEADAVKARELVVDAIEAMRDAVSLYDAEDRLVLANKALLQRSARSPELFIEGTKFEVLIRGFWSEQQTAADPAAFEDFVRSRLAHFRLGDGSPFESQTQDGGWYVTHHFRTRDGGTISLSTEITAAKRAAVEIEAARDTAESANKAKSAFLASMSHEIRTPMNGVLGFAELLLFDTGLSSMQRRHIQGIQEAGKSLLALINDILDLSKIEAGKLEVESIPMNPEAIVDGAASILRSQFAAKALDLRVEFAADVPDWIEGDPTRVRQILLNFMSNALKFTDTGGVVVRSRREAAAGGELLVSSSMPT